MQVCICLSSYDCKAIWAYSFIYVSLNKIVCFVTLGAIILKKNCTYRYQCRKIFGSIQGVCFIVSLIVAVQAHKKHVSIAKNRELLDSSMKYTRLRGRLQKEHRLSLR